MRDRDGRACRPGPARHTPCGRLAVPASRQPQPCRHRARRRLEHPIFRGPRRGQRGRSSGRAPFKASARLGERLAAGILVLIGRARTRRPFGGRRLPCTRSLLRLIGSVRSDAALGRAHEGVVRRRPPDHQQLGRCAGRRAGGLFAMAACRVARASRSSPKTRILISSWLTSARSISASTDGVDPVHRHHHRLERVGLCLERLALRGIRRPGQGPASPVLPVHPRIHQDGRAGGVNSAANPIQWSLRHRRRRPSNTRREVADRQPGYRLHMLIGLVT